MIINKDKLLFRSTPIDAATAITCIIGDSVGHSVTPFLYGEVFERLKLNIAYFCVAVEADKLKTALDGLLAMNIKAAYITMPYKRLVLPMLDELDPMAEMMGAVNMIVNMGGYFKGYNVDICGFEHSLNKVDLTNKKALLMGAGGVGTACAYGLARLGVEMTIIDIDKASAEALAKAIEAQYSIPVRWEIASDETLCREIKEAGIFINATDVGYGEKADQTPVPRELLRNDLIVYDVVNAAETPLIRDAKSVGAVTINGNDFVAYNTKLFVEALTGKEWSDEVTEISREAGEKALRYMDYLKSLK